MISVPCTSLVPICLAWNRKWQKLRILWLPVPSEAHLYLLFWLGNCVTTWLSEHVHVCMCVSLCVQKLISLMGPILCPPLTSVTTVPIPHNVVSCMVETNHYACWHTVTVSCERMEHFAAAWKEGIHHYFLSKYHMKNNFDYRYFQL